jgi:hypothetical protein
MRARRFLIFRSADTSSWWRQQRRLGFRRDAHLFRHIPLREIQLVIFKKQKKKHTHTSIYISRNNLFHKSATFMASTDYLFKCFIADSSQHIIRAFCKTNFVLKLFRTKRDISELSAICGIKFVSLAFHSSSWTFYFWDLWMYVYKIRKDFLPARNFSVLLLV